MDNNYTRFRINHNGNIYILTTEIFSNYVRLRCVEADKSNNLEYTCDFSLDYLRQACPAFYSTLTIRDAQDLINQTIESGKVEIQNTGTQINVVLFLLNQNQNFSLLLNQASNNRVKITYSPPKYLPPKQIILPTQYIKRPTIYTNEIFDYKNNNNSNNIPYYTQNIDEINPIQTNYFPIKTNEIIETTTTIPNYTTTYTTYPNYTADSQKILDMQIETNRIKGEQEKLKAENNRLSNNVQQLNNEIQGLISQKNYLAQNNNSFPDENKNLEILRIKQEIDKLLNQLANLTNSDPSRKIKEDEIAFYKEKLSELLKEKNDSQKEKNDLKQKIQELENNNSILESKYQDILEKSMNFSKMQNEKENLVLVEGNIIENKNELEFLIKKICFNYGKISLDLIYKASVDSDEAEAFHEKCDSAKSTLVLIKSGNGKRFGGFTSCNWSGNSVNKKDDNAFVFSLDKMEIYDIKQGEDAIACYPNYGPIFMGCQILINDKAFSSGGSTCQGGANYNTQEDYELTGGLKDFVVQDIEVYSIRLE